MSFVVSFNGQFKPYILPDLSNSNRVHHINKNTLAKEVLDHEESFDFELKRFKEKSSKSSLKTGITQYHKTQKVDQFKVSHLARDIMSTSVHCHYSDETFSDLAKTMDKYHYRHIPILNREEILTGIVSDRDMLRLTQSEGHSKELVKNFMTTEVLIAQTNTRIQDIAKIMLYEKISALPIVNHKNILVGIITQSDILDYIIHSMPLNVDA
jgi:CBS domain-containing protein